MCRLVIIVLFSIVCEGIYGQETLLEWDHYKVEDGLPHRNVFSVAQDNRGLMWMATDDGLARFDGYKFTAFTKSEHGLYSDRQRTVYTGPDGHLWLFYYGGYYFGSQGREVIIECFDPVTHCVVPLADILPDTITKAIRHPKYFARLSDGTILFQLSDLVVIRYLGSGQYQQWRLPEPMILKKVVDGPEGIIWAGAELENRSMMTLSMSPRGEVVTASTASTDYDQVVPISVFKESKPLIATLRRGSAALHSLDESYQLRQALRDGLFATHTKRPTEPEWLMVKCVESESFIWILTGNEVLLHNKNTNTTEQITDQIPGFKLLHDLYSDAQGAIWATSQLGVFRLEARQNQFTTYLKGAIDSITSIRGIVQAPTGDLYASYPNDETVVRIQLESATNARPNYKKVLADNSPVIARKWRRPQLQYAISPVLTLDKPNQRILTTRAYSNYQSYLVRIDPVTLESEQHLIGDSIGGVWSMYHVDDSTYWLGDSNHELVYISGDSSRYIDIPDELDRPVLTYQFLERDDGLFWLATDRGLCVLDPVSGAVVAQYNNRGTGEYYLPFERLHHIHIQPRDGLLWLATGGQGIVVWDPHTGVWKQYTRKDGLSSDVVYAVYEHEGSLWLPSDYGLMKFDPVSGSVMTYLERDGIAHNEFNRIAHTRLADGSFAFGGMNGITRFHPSDFPDNYTTRRSAPVVWNVCRQFDTNEHRMMDITAAVLKSGEIQLTTQRPFATLEFAMLTYADARRVEYAYQIEGIDEEWVYTKENTLRLGRQLPYGAHTLRIKAQSVNGSWSANELELTIINVQPLHTRWWFWVGLAGLLGSGLWMWNRRRVRRYERRQLQLEHVVARRTDQIRSDKATIEEQAHRLRELEQLKSRFYTNISHELRTPLTLILGPLNTLRAHASLDDQSKVLIAYARRNARSLLKLVNELLDLSKLERKDIRPHYAHIDLAVWLPNLIRQFEVAALQKQIDLRCHIPTDAPRTLYADPNMVAKILSNYLSNALKHTPPEGSVTVSTTATNGQMRLSVADTGAGIAESDLPHIFDRYYQSTDARPGLSTIGTGVGLAHAAELAKVMRGRVGVDNRHPVGSTFYLELPLHLELPLAVATPSDAVATMPPLAADVAEVGGATVLPTTKGDAHEGCILLVEDHPELRSYICTILPEYHIHITENGYQAQRYLEQNPDAIDLIISDYMMPIMNGEALLRFVKGDDRWRHLPFILLTAHTERDTRLGLLRMGIDDYLTKPFDEEELRARIGSLLANARLRAHRSPTATTDDTTTSTELHSGLSDADTEWMQQVEAVVTECIEQGIVNVTYVAEKLNLSERQFRRRVKQVVGTAPKQYIQEIQLQYAKALLEAGHEMSIKKVAERAAFGDAKYFSRNFKKRFGKSPIHYLDQIEF